ncbi:MAG TPA: tryptophan synthase subunit alpha [Thermodesulfobacteriota bacterium]|jgi:tryptophan synthase alpha chain|nr:tryptophan synthase subunit alpha [Thermodesulfobacteriota bacterium]
MRIENKFKELRKKGKAALVTYITAGDPSLDITPDIVLKLEESGADIIELGVPFSDPMADGPTIQLASERALRSGTTLSGVLEAVKEIRRHSDIPILIFGYYNPFLAYGLSRFSEDAKKAGADGVLVVDLPPEEAEEFKTHTDRAGLNLIFLLAPTSTAERIELVSENASGFVYLVSVTGVTGVRPDMDYSLESLVQEIKKRTKLPVGVGFGVSTPEQASRIARFADAVIVGSALVKIIENNGQNRNGLLEEIGEFIRGLSEACRNPKQ